MVCVLTSVNLLADLELLQNIPFACPAALKVLSVDFEG